MFVGVFVGTRDQWWNDAWQAWIIASVSSSVRVFLSRYSQVLLNNLMPRLFSAAASSFVFVMFRRYARRPFDDKGHWETRPRGGASVLFLPRRRTPTLRV